MNTIFTADAAAAAIVFTRIFVVNWTLMAEVMIVRGIMHPPHVDSLFDVQILAHPHTKM